MTPKFISFLAWCWFWGALMCLILEGSYFGSYELGIINYLTGFNTIEMGGLWGVPRLIIGFFTHGLPALITWDYTFFQGGYTFIRLLLIAVLSSSAVWGIASAFFGVVTRSI